MSARLAVAPIGGALAGDDGVRRIRLREGHDEMNPKSIAREASLVPKSQLFISEVGSLWEGALA
jgi:hypothetical protein